MRVLLDTNALLWFLLEPIRLSRTALSTMTDPDNQLLVSPASYWETAIKISIGKYRLRESLDVFFERELRENAMGVLPIA